MKPTDENLKRWRDFCFIPHIGLLPHQLEKDLEGWDGELQPTPEEGFASAMEDLLNEALRLDDFYQNPYHNFRNHFAGMIDRTRQLLEMGRYPRAIEQAMIMAALGHDIGHPGSTFRRNARKPIQMPGLGSDVSNELVSGHITDVYAARHGLNVGQRLCIYSAIYATLFGDPDFQIPDHPLARLIANADIAPSTGVLEWLEQGIRVLEETPAEERPQSFDYWMKGRQKFIAFITSRMTSDGWALWGKNLAHIRIAVEAMVKGRDRELKVMVQRRVSHLLQQ